MKSHILQCYLFCSTANHAHKSWVRQEQFYQPVNTGNFGLSFNTFLGFANSDLKSAAKSYLALYSTLHLTGVTFFLYIHHLQVTSIKLNFKLFSSSASQKIAKW